MERLYESMISSLESDNNLLRSTVEELQTELEKLTSARPSVDRKCGSDSLLSQSSKSASTDVTQTNSVSVETGEDERLTLLKQSVEALEGRLAEKEAKNMLLQKKAEEDSVKLADSRFDCESSRERLLLLESDQSQLLNKNKSLENSASDYKAKIKSLTTESNKTRIHLTSQLEQAKNSVSYLNAETTALRQQITQLQTEGMRLKQREVELSSEMTRLTLDRSNLQAKVNSTTAELVQHKAHSVSQAVRIRQLESSNLSLESELSAFKSDSVDLVAQLESIKQEKDEMSLQLSSLHDQVSEKVSLWQRELQSKQESHQQVCSI